MCNIKRGSRRAATNGVSDVNSTPQATLFSPSEPVSWPLLPGVHVGTCSHIGQAACDIIIFRETDMRTAAAGAAQGTGICKLQWVGVMEVQVNRGEGVIVGGRG